MLFNTERVFDHLLAQILLTCGHKLSICVAAIRTNFTPSSLFEIEQARFATYNEISRIRIKFEANEPFHTFFSTYWALARMKELYTRGMIQDLLYWWKTDIDYFLTSKTELVIFFIRFIEKHSLAVKCIASSSRARE